MTIFEHFRHHGNVNVGIVCLNLLIQMLCLRFWFISTQISKSSSSKWFDFVPFQQFPIFCYICSLFMNIKIKHRSWRQILSEIPKKFTIIMFLTYLIDFNVFIYLKFFHLIYSTHNKVYMTSLIYWFLLFIYSYSLLSKTDARCVTYEQHTYVYYIQ